MDTKFAAPKGGAKRKGSRTSARGSMKLITPANKALAKDLAFRHGTIVAASAAHAAMPAWQRFSVPVVNKSVDSRVIPALGLLALGAFKKGGKWNDRAIQVGEGFAGSFLADLGRKLGSDYASSDGVGAVNRGAGAPTARIVNLESRISKLIATADRLRAERGLPPSQFSRDDRRLARLSREEQREAGYAQAIADLQGQQALPDYGAGYGADPYAGYYGEVPNYLPTL